MPSQFTFVDLFAGIGGFHQACKRAGGKCVAACEIDENARKMYMANYGITPLPDIRTISPIPGIDLVCGGFPCQSHSTLGLRKGLRDSRGKLFHNLCDFIHASQPKAFILENVKGILSSTRFPHIISELTKCGYQVSWSVLNSSDFGLPQHRERVYIVGKRQTPFDWSALETSRRHVIINDIIDARTRNDSSLDCHIFDNMTLFKEPKRTPVGFILLAKRSNFTNRKLFSSNGIVGTIATASPPPIFDEKTGRIRHLSTKELLACQGFRTSFKFPVGASRSFAVHYIGNAVSVSVVHEVVKNVKKQCDL